MKKIFLLVSTLCSLVIGFGQGTQTGPGSIGQNDPAATRLLNAVSKKFKSFKGIQAGFTLKIEDGTGKVLGVKKGTVSMKGNKYHILITGQEIFCDGTTTWTFDKGANEVTITQVDASTNTITPQKLFTNFYDKDFLSRLNGEARVGKKVVEEIEMTPVDKSKPFHKVYLLIDKKALTVYSTKVLEKNGNRYSYTINSFNGHANLGDDDFRFDKSKYPGVEVIDLR